VFKNLIVGAALSLSSFAFAGPSHHAVPVGPPVPVMQNDRFDVAQGRMLLRELDMARRNPYAMRDLDLRIRAFIEAELAESRRDSRSEFGRRERREERDSSRQLSRILSAYSRVEGRFGGRALAEKRQLLSEAIDVAERDLRDGRPDRFSRR
jgi:hypothetical protein